MATNQQQDLIIYRDNSIVSNKLLDSDESSLTMVSYVDETQASWFTNTIVENSLYGTAVLVNKELRKTPKRSDVYVISFSNNKEFYVKAIKKCGLDLEKDKNFHFIDCFTDLFTKQITDPINACNQVNKLFDSIMKTIEAETSSNKKTIIIENPEYLLSATKTSSIELLNHMVRLNRLCRHLIIISSHRQPQNVDLNVGDVLDPTYKTTNFLAKLHQRCNLNIYLEPLTTGRANDITGILTISRGGIPYQSGLVIAEREYIYHISKESNIKLYFR